VFKVLIVDDEEWVRLDLRESIKWCALDLKISTEAQNGVEAKIAIEKDLPDIVITDIRMPVIDGIKLIEYIHEEYPQILVIILSGYSEFEYARNAIVFNVFDYLLKPIEEEKLKEVLIKAIEKIQTFQNSKKSILKYEKQIYESKPYMKIKLLNELISNRNLGADNIKDILKKADFDFCLFRYIAMAVKVLNFPAIISEKYSNDCNLGEYSLLNVVDEVIGGGNNAVVFKNHYRQNELVIIKGFNGKENADVFNEALSLAIRVKDLVLNIIYQFFSFIFRIDIGIFQCVQFIAADDAVIRHQPCFFNNFNGFNK